MNKYVTLTLLITFTFHSIFGQVGINTTTPDPSSMLHVESSTSGLLIPIHTTLERDAVANPANGLLIFNTDLNTFQYNSGTKPLPAWVNVSYNASVKYSNTDISTNINTTVSTNIPILGTLEWNDNTSIYTIVGNTMTINYPGKYRIIANISYAVPTVGGNSDNRVAVEAQLAINNTPTGTIAATGYVRHANGHREASLHITEVFNLVSGDVISVKTIRSGNSAPANMRSIGSSNLIIERL